MIVVTADQIRCRSAEVGVGPGQNDRGITIFHQFPRDRGTSNRHDRYIAAAAPGEFSSYVVWKDRQAFAIGKEPFGEKEQRNRPPQHPSEDFQGPLDTLGVHTDNNQIRIGNRCRKLRIVGNHQTGAGDHNAKTRVRAVASHLRQQISVEMSAYQPYFVPFIDTGY